VTEPSPDDRKYRNYVIAAAVGGVLLPIAGMVGAMVFWTRGDERAARAIAIASAAGLVLYVILFALL
jgi:zinc transporter ZupT